MATIVLPGKKSVTIEGQPTLADLKQQALVPAAYRLVRKDSAGVVRELRDDEPVGGEDVVFAVPSHRQGGDAAV